MKLKVALIEDNEDTCELMQDWLSGIGSEQDIRCFSEGGKALDFLDQELAKPEEQARFVPNLIILDLGLPDQNGIEVLKKLKSSPQLRQVEVIVNSAAKDDNQMRDTYRYGGCAFIRKQGSDRQLLESIQRLILSGRIS